MVKTNWLCEKTHLKKGVWSPEEDHKLIAYIKRYGIWNWTELSKAAGLARSGKSCRLRWVNYLKPDIKHGNFSKEEKETIIALHETLGNRWSAIAAKLPGRTDNEVKNYWHTHLKKGLKQMQANSSASTYTSTILSNEFEAAKPNSNDDEASLGNNLSAQSTQLSFAHNQPSESSKLEGTSSNILVPPHDFSPASTMNCSTRINQNVNDQINITNASDAFEEIVHSLWTPPVGNGGLNTTEDAQATFVDHPDHHGQLIATGPSCSTNSEAMGQQDPIWPYDLYELEYLCNDWEYFMDTRF